MDPADDEPAAVPRLGDRHALRQGLADPRGCEYRTIRIKVGGVWGGQAQEVSTYGWVLPVAAGGKPRHAIAWSGLVYPLAGSGEPVDLDGDIRALEDAAGRANAAAKGRPGQQVGFNGFGTNSEGSAVSVATLLPIKVCLLLRLGRADLAELIWAAGTGRPKDPEPKPVGARPKLDLNSYGISYLTLARDLAWYRFDRAICAHMRGDDPLALADVRALDALALAVDTRAEAMGFARPDRQVPPGQLRPTSNSWTSCPSSGTTRSGARGSAPTRRPRFAARDGRPGSRS